MTDDSTNMQTFLTALGTTPYPIGIINGTSSPGHTCYMGTTQLNVPSSAVIIGGTRQTTLKWQSATTSRMLKLAANVTMKNLIIDGTTKALQVAIYPQGVSGTHLEDMQINNVSDCYYADANGIASNYGVLVNVSCSSADIGFAFVGISNSNSLYSVRCITVTTCIQDDGNNNSSVGGKFEITTTGIRLNATSSGFSSLGDRFENTPTSGTGFLTISGAAKAQLVNPHFAGLTTNVNYAANALINSPFEYRTTVTINSLIAANSVFDISVTTGVMANCKASAEVTATLNGGTAPAGITAVGMYRVGIGPYVRVANVTTGGITPNTDAVLTCRQRQ